MSVVSTQPNWRPRLQVFSQQGSNANLYIKKLLVTLICFILYFSAGLSTVIASDHCRSRGPDYSRINLLQSVAFQLPCQPLLPQIIVNLGDDSHKQPSC